MSGAKSARIWRSDSLSKVLNKIIDYRGISVPKSETGVPLITARNVRDGTLDFSINEFINAAAYAEWKSRGVPAPGDVLFTTEAPLGKVAPFPLTGEYAIGQRVVAMRPKTEVLDSGYLLQFLLSPIGQRRVDLFSTGSTAKGISSGQLHKVVIDYPELPIQQQTAALLSLWDASIQKTEQLIAAKERHRDALIQRLYALSDRRGNASRFRELLKESTEAGNSGRHAKKITVKLYGKGVLAKEEKRQGSEQTQYFIRRAGQLIYSKLDFLNGAFGIVPPELDGFESTLDLPAFDIASTVNPIWLLGYLTRPTYYTHQVGLARGQRKARRVHPSDLLASSLHVPPRDLQDRIAEILTSSQDDIEKSKHLLQSLKAQKRGLMQKLLTGKWRLPITEEFSA